MLQTNGKLCSVPYIGVLALSEGFRRQDYRQSAQNNISEWSGCRQTLFDTSVILLRHIAIFINWPRDLKKYYDHQLHYYYEYLPGSPLNRLSTRRYFVLVFVGLLFASKALRACRTVLPPVFVSRVSSVTSTRVVFSVGALRTFVLRFFRPELRFVCHTRFFCASSLKLGSWWPCFSPRPPSTSVQRCSSITHMPALLVWVAFWGIPKIKNQYAPHDLQICRYSGICRNATGWNSQRT